MIYIKRVYVFLIIGIILLSGCSVYPNVSQDQKVPKGTAGLIEKNDSDNNSQPINNNTSPQKNVSEENPVGEKDKNVLEILGRSKNLSKKAWANMLTWRGEMVGVVKKYPDEVFINGYYKEKMVALTFDDGPDQVNTPKIINILRDNGVIGNFFFIGQKAVQNHDIVLKAFEEGNLVLSHGYHHLDMTTMTSDQIKKEISQNNKIFYDLFGKIPALIRPPYGAINEDVIKQATSADEKIILWSIDTLDWSQMEKDNIVKNVLNNVRPGEIILMHSNEDKTATVEALPDLIQGLKQQGYQIVGLDQLLGVSAYH